MIVKRDQIGNAFKRALKPAINFIGRIIGRINWFIVLGSILALVTVLVIAAPIYYYRKDFHELPRSSNPADWGTFGDFFGGILNPLISLLTLIVTIIIAVRISKIEKRNHDEAVHSPVKPLFTIGTGQFFSSDISTIGPTVGADFYSYRPPQKPAGLLDYLREKLFYLKIFNKGLSVASEVVVTFEINLNELKQLLAFDHAKIKVTSSDIKADEDGREFIILNINSNDFNHYGIMKIWPVEKYGLGVVEKGKKVKAPFPSQIISAFQLYNLKRRLNIPIDNFPAIFVTLSYKNIHGKQLVSKFRVGLFHMHDYVNFSVFKILQEHI
jgi:uncharacterized membrane protein